MFRLGQKTSQWIKVWEVEDKGSWSKVKVDSSKADKKNEGQYISSNCFAAFFGDAHSKASTLTKGDTIEILDGGIEFPYSKEHKKVFVNITVNDFKKMDSNGGGSNTKKSDDGFVAVDNFDDDDLPF